MNIRTLFLIIALFNSTSVCSNELITAALAHPERFQSDIKSDLNRKPAKVLSFLEIKPGQSVLDVFSGSGYYTELVSRIVGDTGHVDAHNNLPYINYIGLDKIAERFKDNRLANVSQLQQEANELELLANNYDRILLILSFHDLYHVDEKNGWQKIDAPRFMRELRHALKPDGLLGIVDHVAPADSGTQAGESLHRIDPMLVKTKMAEWGFTLVKESDALQNLDDPLNVPMWDSKVRGHTSRMLMTFKKD